MSYKEIMTYYAAVNRITDEALSSSLNLKVFIWCYWTSHWPSPAPEVPPLTVRGLHWKTPRMLICPEMLIITPKKRNSRLIIISFYFTSPYFSAFFTGEQNKLHQWKQQKYGTISRMGPRVTKHGTAICPKSINAIVKTWPCSFSRPVSVLPSGYFEYLLFQIN